MRTKAAAHKTATRKAATDKAVTRTPRGRPREFDTGEKLQRITEVFLRRGYSGCSLEDISAATGLTKPSLYAAYGDKKAMYLLALEQFALLARTAIGGALFHGSNLSADLRSAYFAAIDLYLESGPRGCLAVCTATTECTEDDAIRELLATIFDEMDTAFGKRMAAAKKAGDLSSKVDTVALASIAVAMLHSIAVRARAGSSKRELRSLADSAVTAICR